MRFLSHIIDFCSVVLMRKSRDDDAIWRGAGVHDGKVIISKSCIVDGNNDSINRYRTRR